jgi:CRP/FNR family transcriptional regulator, cyclic AMP receptor protein
MNHSLREKLKTNPWFGMLTEPHLQKLVDIASEKQWRAGESIFREGETDPCLYFVLAGRVALDIYVPTRGRVTFLTVAEDEIFGWSAMLPVVGIKTASGRALQETTAVAFNATALRQACEEDHDLGYHVYRRLTNVIAARLTAARLQLLDMYATSNSGENR